MVGKPHGGMAAMFTMMNNARLGVGCQGIGVGEGAYQHALAYALDRKQGRTPVNGKFIVIWTRGGDGTWRLHRDIWNTDA